MLSSPTARRRSRRRWPSTPRGAVQTNPTPTKDIRPLSRWAWAQVRLVETASGAGAALITVLAWRHRRSHQIGCVFFRNRAAIPAVTINRACGPMRHRQDPASAALDGQPDPRAQAAERAVLQHDLAAMGPDDVARDCQA